MVQKNVGQLFLTKCIYIVLFLTGLKKYKPLLAADTVCNFFYTTTIISTFGMTEVGLLSYITRFLIQARQLTLFIIFQGLLRSNIFVQRCIFFVFF